MRVFSGCLLPIGPLIRLYAFKRGRRVLVFVAGWVWPGCRPAANRVLSR